MNSTCPTRLPAAALVLLLLLLALLVEPASAAAADGRHRPSPRRSPRCTAAARPFSPGRSAPTWPPSATASIATARRSAPPTWPRRSCWLRSAKARRPFLPTATRTTATPPVWNWAYRYSERLIDRRRRPGAGGGTGLLVWTLASPTLRRRPAAPVTMRSRPWLAGDRKPQRLWRRQQAAPWPRRWRCPGPCASAAKANGWQVYIQYMDLRDWNPTFHAPNALQQLLWPHAGRPRRARRAPVCLRLRPLRAGCGAAAAAHCRRTCRSSSTSIAWRGDTYGPLAGARRPLVRLHPGAGGPERDLVVWLCPRQ